MSTPRRTLNPCAPAANTAASRPAAGVNGGPAPDRTGDRTGGRSWRFAGPLRASEGVKAAPTGPRTAYQAAAPGVPPLRDSGSLAGVLAGLNPATEPADPELLAAAVVFGRCRGADPRRRLVWMHYAYRSARQLWGDANPATLRISRAYQRLATELGHLLPAVVAAEHRLRVYRQLGSTEQELSTRLELAALLCQAGLCESALAQITDTWTRWQASRRDPDTGRRILLDQAVILAGCGRSTDTTTVLTQHSGLLRDATAELIELTANRLTAAEICHRPVCRHPVPSKPPFRYTDDRLAFWTALLHQAVAGEPPAPRRRLGPDHEPVPPTASPSEATA
jgi:hypothetical protein